MFHRRLLSGSHDQYSVLAFIFQRSSFLDSETVVLCQIHNPRTIFSAGTPPLTSVVVLASVSHIPGTLVGNGSGLEPECQRVTWT